jgi:glycerol-3-phosphate dehydrogenase
MNKPSAIVIGAGFTGCATAHDLALRGFDVQVLDRGDIAYGTSGRTHGLLHSGGRYCVNDIESAVECIQENMILRSITPQCIEPNGGFFIALSESDMVYRDAWVAGAQRCGIPIEALSPAQALRLEPEINPKLLAAYQVPDGTFEPLRLALAFAASAKKRGAQFKLYSEVKGFLLNGQRKVTGVRYCDHVTGLEAELKADIVVNATGAWAGLLAAMIPVDVNVRPTPGVMVAFDKRLTQRAINRLCEPDDGDIVLPQRRMVVVGTTSFEVEDVDYVPVLEEQVAMMVERGAELVPGIRQARQRGAYMSSRPLVGGGVSARSVARTFKCFDHLVTDGVDGIVTITGGKATTCRVMAEKTVDMVCRKLGYQVECQTKVVALEPYRTFYMM